MNDEQAENLEKMIENLVVELSLLNTNLNLLTKTIKNKDEKTYSKLLETLQK